LEALADDTDTQSLLQDLSQIRRDDTKPKSCKVPVYDLLIRVDKMLDDVLTRVSRIEEEMKGNKGSTVSVDVDEDTQSFEWDGIN
jgi:hypothetical protein